MRFLRLLMLYLSLLGLAHAASPAQDLFDEAVYFLSLHYGGFAEPGPRELVPNYRPLLEAACAEAAEPCPAEVAAEVVESLLEALGDAHTNLYPPELFEELQRLLGGEGETPGFGLLVRELTGEGLVVLEVVAGSPADRAGLDRGDLIVRLDDAALDQAATSLLWERETSGEPVALTVLREGRERLELELRSEPLSRKRLPELVLEGGVARLRLPSFLPALEVAARLHALVAEASAAGAQAMLIDLRDNPGGFLSDCLVGAAAFVDAPARVLRSTLFTQTVRAEDGRLYSRSGEGREFAQTVTEGPARFAGPVAVLVNARSGSCAEFFALDLQEAGAVVVGERTAGVANTATTFLRLTGGWGLQVTVAQVLDADGRPYPAHVTPDIELEDDLSALVKGRDLVLEAGLEELRDALGALD